ncbi:MAG: hypothetical protein CL928_09800 [Deltaproteobacteria bacterium]|nr:hypothetical protein [Deltaproteobacteria bacterium]
MLAALGLSIVGTPTMVQAGVYIGLRQDRIDPSRGEQATLIVSFDEKLFRAMVTVSSSDTGFSKSWPFKPVTVGKEYTLSWSQGEGSAMYDVSVEMVTLDGEHQLEETAVYVTSASPLTASIPPETVDLASRSFDLVTNHPPSHVELEVLADDQRVVGQSTFEVVGAEQGKPVRVTWEQQEPGNIFRIAARAHDEYGYWAEVEIIPWSLSIPHEDVHFETGNHVISEDQKPKMDEPWRLIREAVTTYGAWVRCALYVAGYTDTVGDAGSNQQLSDRRALSLARHFQQRGADFPIFYRGYGEKVPAVPTADNTDEVRNRRALYVITAGPPPRGGDTPGGAWKRLQ